MQFVVAGGNLDDRLTDTEASCLLCGFALMLLPAASPKLASVFLQGEMLMTGAWALAPQCITLLRLKGGFCPWEMHTLLRGTLNSTVSLSALHRTELDAPINMLLCPTLLGHSVHALCQPVRFEDANMLHVFDILYTPLLCCLTAFEDSKPNIAALWP